MFVNVTGRLPSSGVTICMSAWPLNVTVVVLQSASLSDPDPDTDTNTNANHNGNPDSDSDPNPNLEPPPVHELNLTLALALTWSSDPAARRCWRPGSPPQGIRASGSWSRPGLGSRSGLGRGLQLRLRVR